MAHLPYCRDVTVGVSSSSGLAPLLRRAAERWQDLPVVYINLDRITVGFMPLTRMGDIKRPCVRSEPIGFNVFIHRTYCNALFIVFISGVFAW